MRPLLAATVCFIAVLANALGTANFARADSFDMVLLLDESGSMKTNDPRKARQSAAEMFLMLCKPEHRVQLVGFATNTEIKAGFDIMGQGQGREGVVRALGRIRSDGQWTDIEGALQLALAELRRDGLPDATHTILLMTDGKVDLEPGETAKESRSILRIRGELTSELIQNGVRVYCVAFSQGADRALLEYLAESTGGMCVQGDRDDELQRLFLRIFEEVAKPQTVPLADSKAYLDASVREATFLITMKADGKRPTLITPDGKEISHGNYDRMRNVQWFRTPRYDMVTIGQPTSGEWRIRPPNATDDDRLIILTDMELTLENFASVSQANEEKTLRARLVSDGNTVAAPEILERLEIEARLHAAGLGRFPLLDDGRHRDIGEGDGVFGGYMRAPRKRGTYDLELIARAPTLERRIVRTVQVVDRWFYVELEKEVVAPGQSMPLKVILPHGPPVPGKAVQFRVAVAGPDSTRELDAIEIGPALYSVAIEDTQASGDYTVAVTGAVADQNDAALRQTVGPLRFRVVRSLAQPLAVPPPAGAHTPARTAPPAEHTNQAHQAPPTEKPHPEPAHTQPAHDAHATPTPVETAKDDTGGGRVWLAIQVGILLLLLANAGLVAFLLVRKRSSTQQATQGAGSMEKLRSKAAAIRDGGYEVPDQDRAVAYPQSDESEPPGKGPTERDAEAVAAAETILADASQDEQERTQQDSSDLDRALGANRDDVELIPEPGTEEAAKEEQDGEAAEEEEETPETPGDDALSNTEADLLAEIMGEGKQQEEPTEHPQAEEPEPTAQAIPEEDRADEAPDDEPDLPPEESEDFGKGLSTNESDLLAEIMGEVDQAAGAQSDDSGANAPEEPEAPRETEEDQTPEAQPAASGDDLDDSESSLLAEIMGETTDEDESGTLSPGTGGTPKIPDESDDKSDQDAIDDILKQIEGLVE